jgi:methyl-accepting chemotaxis protein
MACEAAIRSGQVADAVAEIASPGAAGALALRCNRSARAAPVMCPAEARVAAATDAILWRAPARDGAGGISRRFGMRLAALSNRSGLLVALGAVVLATGVCAGIEWWGVRYVRAVLGGFRHGDVALAEVVGNLHDDILQLRRYEKDVFINIGSADERDGYRAKWDEAFLILRSDLTRTRALAPPSAGAGLQDFVDSMAAYRSAFTRTYDGIRAGNVVTPQQANEQMGEAKAAAHQAEQQLIELERGAQLRMTELADPVSAAGWVGLAMNLALLVLVGGPLAWAVRQSAHPPISER